MALALPSELFFEMLSYSHNIHQLNMINQSAYNTYTSDNFWQNLFYNYYKCEINNSIKFPRNLTYVIKQTYQFLSNIDYNYTILSTRMMFSDLDTYLKKHIPWVYIKNDELLIIHIKENQYTLKFMQFEKKISEQEARQIIFDCFLGGKVVAKMTYKKL